MKRFKILAGIALAIAAGAVQAAEKMHEHHDGAMGRHHGMGMSVEHVAMHNIMAGLIANKTGRSEAEVRAMFEAGDPHDVVDKLGLTRDDMHALMKQAHETLVSKAAAAGLITADQAAKIRAMPLPDHPPQDDR